MNVKPLKRFGQNYLRDKNTIKKIIGIFAPDENDAVVEIGPGQGALTELLSERVKSLCAVEIDNRVIENLSERFPGVFFINSDFLKIKFDNLPCSAPLRIIGNIPYNITAPILFKLIDERKKISDALLMVQYEVAERLIAKPKTKQYGLLSVILNYFAEVELKFKISPNVFYPKPKVNSAIVSVKFKSNNAKDANEKLFIDVVKAAFSTRRKTLKNSLSNTIFKNCIKNISQFDLTRRAEELSVQEFVELANIIGEIYERNELPEHDKQSGLYR